MNSNPFIVAREALPSLVTTLPPGLLEGNAARLLGIVEELKRSYLVELRVVDAVRRVQVEDRGAVSALRKDLEHYRDARFFDDERTHCHNIDRIADSVMGSAEAAAQPADADRLNEVLQPLRNADAGYLDDIESILDEAVDAIVEMDEGRIKDADAAQARFSEAMAPRIERVRHRLKEMNTLANALIDRM